jgi:protein-S-isoprenylcysteine O-methyltransferase Ste14
MKVTAFVASLAKGKDGRHIMGQGGVIMLFMVPSLVAAIGLHVYLPAVSLLTLTWIYLVPAVDLVIAVHMFIGREEAQLANAFGAEYEGYQARVDRLVPFRKPRAPAGPLARV